VSTEPQSDAAREAFVAQLVARLDRGGSRPEPGGDREIEAPSNVELDGTEDAQLPVTEAARLDGVVAALSAPGAWSEPPDLRSAVLTMVRAQAEDGRWAIAEPASTRAGSEAPAPAEPEPTPQTEPAPATVTVLRPRRPRLAVVLPLAAAAAVVITLTVLGVQAVLRPGPDQTFTALGSDHLRAKVTVTSKPSGFEVTLEAKDLPAAPVGSYYAAWLRRGPGPGDVVPIGTFHGRRVGGPIVLWSGVDPAEYRTFSVTLQRDGEPPLPNAPSAHRVLAGTVGG
jgi:hypothetical protein